MAGRCRVNPDSVGTLALSNDRARFRVWAPHARSIELRITAPEERVVALENAGGGYYEAIVEDVRPGARYFYRLNGELERPDPASRCQPEGVHSSSMVVNSEHEWRDSRWRNLPLADYVIYELHVGTFSREGTFDGVLPCLSSLQDLGITALELMPVAQFPGTRNWGYDGAYPFAVQASYGGPRGLHKLVDECHALGLAVVLDVVYNHLGPEGNYLADYGPYFTDRYRTPWGPALNFDGPQSDDVRRFFIDNALFWFREFHIDALRLDAVHAIHDSSATPFLRELAEEVSIHSKVLGRPLYLIAESAANDPRVVRSADRGGLGLDAQWNDDFHHALHVTFTGERAGYYADYDGLRDLASAFEHSYVLTGSFSEYRQRHFGAPCDDVPPEKFVVFAQNHDQVGNRLLGDRLSTLVPFEALKLGAAVVCLSPYLPLLFMGEEYGEVAPFLFFVSHSDPGLIEAIRNGRREEFKKFAWAGELPDPQAEETFERSRPAIARKETPQGDALFRLYRELFRIRKWHPALQFPSRDSVNVDVLEDVSTLVVHRRRTWALATAIFHFGKSEATLQIKFPGGTWRKVLDTSDEAWAGPGGRAAGVVVSDGGATVQMAPQAALLYEASERG
ncbi:MAG: malto-oligosyltrehalose trehalohydrolase [Chloroflexi bacterium]|nr:malto-oligosyltrehalose trehalohydrolase [Chloroflexota bacterium]